VVGFELPRREADYEDIAVRTTPPIGFRRFLKSAALPLTSELAPGP